MPTYRIKYGCHHCNKHWIETKNHLEEGGVCPECETSECPCLSFTRRSMKKDLFIEKAYEIAYGFNAINKGYDREEVIDRLKEFALDSLKYENNQVELKREDSKELTK